ncbi:uncharacterized protein LOC105181259 [Harpegnathos saltator]|uniref:Apolipophorin-III n=1 Tax=Harpegnathos saltator TaxID=610380 RepID=E2BCC1_HARSA|nr:uncharacterized protein LOC105181259 [Harpegnathos saltator]EFN86657.1 hypothetical protein EAI_03690 [Harpegnathos saltator]
MRCILAVAFTVVLIAAEGKAMPASDVEIQQPTVQPLELSDYIRHAQNSITEFGAEMQKQFNQAVPNQEEYLNTLKEQSSHFFNNIQNQVQNMTEEVKAKTPELEHLMTNFKTKLSEAFNKITTNEEAEEHVNQIQARIQESLRTVMNESQNVMENVNKNSAKVQEDISKFVKGLVDFASENLKNFSPEATTQKTEEHS